MYLCSALCIFKIKAEMNIDLIEIEYEFLLIQHNIRRFPLVEYATASRRVPSRVVGIHREFFDTIADIPDNVLKITLEYNLITVFKTKELTEQTLL